MFINVGKKKEWVCFWKELVSIEFDYGDIVVVVNFSLVFDFIVLWLSFIGLWIIEVLR